jgi:hypothetical protein
MVYWSQISMVMGNLKAIATEPRRGDCAIRTA